MLKEEAVVVSTAGSRAKVAIVRSEACGSCPAKTMCSAASGNINVLEVRNPVKARPGARVVIELRPGALVKASALLYLVPAFSMVLGATLGWTWASSDPGAMTGALAGFAIATLFLYLHGRKERSAAGPAISDVLSPGLAPDPAQTDRTHLPETPSAKERTFHRLDDIKRDPTVTGAR